MTCPKDPIKSSWVIKIVAAYFMAKTMLFSHCFDQCLRTRHRFQKGATNNLATHTLVLNFFSAARTAN